MIYKSIYSHKYNELLKMDGIGEYSFKNKKIFNPIKYLDNGKAILFSFSNLGKHEIIVDIESLPKLAINKMWSVAKHSLSEDLFYSIVNIEYTRISMHRFLLDLKCGEDSDKKIIDHIDRNGLNNCISNLRIVNHSENMLNKKVYKNSTTGVKGVVTKKGKHYMNVVREINFINKQKTILLLKEIYKLIDKHNEDMPKIHNEDIIKDVFENKNRTLDLFNTLDKIKKYKKTLTNCKIIERYKKHNGTPTQKKQ